VQIHSRRVHRFDDEPPEVWAALTSVDRYRSWWPWLTHLEADGFAPGATWRCEVRPPLRYRVRFELHLGDVAVAESVDATLRGDIAGHARLTLAPPPDGGTVLRLESWLAPSAPWLRALSSLARPVTQRGHDWVLDTGLRQFEARALR
jgi:hypothetical protein